MSRHLKVISASVVTGRGTDKIRLTFDNETTFPLMPEYGCSASFEAQAGFGAEWVRRTLGLEAEVINVNYV